jgi:hypothetical protein
MLRGPGVSGSWGICRSIGYSLPAGSGLRVIPNSARSCMFIDRATDAVHPARVKCCRTLGHCTPGGVLGLMALRAINIALLAECWA